MNTQPAITDKFAANLRRIRNREGLSYTAAARNLGCARSTWIKWENGQRVPGLRQIEAIAEMFSCSPKTLIG